VTGMGAEGLIMAVSGLLVAAGVPALLLATPEHGLWSRLSQPWTVALPLFVTLHAVVTLMSPTVSSLWFRVLLEAALLCGAAVYWLPVLGSRHRLDEPARAVYLYVSMPLLDLPAVVMVALGHVVGGLAMVVSMLPIGVAAWAITWRWISEEERLTRVGTAPD